MDFRWQDYKKQDKIKLYETYVRKYKSDYYIYKYYLDDKKEEE